MCASRCHFDKGRHSLSSKGSSNLKWRVETYLQGACRDYLIPMAASIAEKKSSLKFAPQKNRSLTLAIKVWFTKEKEHIIGQDDKADRNLLYFLFAF